MGRTWEFYIDGQKDRPVTVRISKQVLAGRTSRDIEDAKKHLEELRKTGVTLSDEVPIFHTKLAGRLTQGALLEAVPGWQSSGEVEFILLVNEDGAVYVTVGSDHTDRDLQKYNTNLAKQMFDTVVAPAVWLYEDILDHWDDLEMRSWVDDHGKEILYQEGKLAEMLRPEFMINKVKEKAVDGDIRGALIAGGTFPTLTGDLNYGSKFRFELADPVKGKSIKHAYEVRPIAWFGGH
jgi:hypothetical protein